MKKASDLFSQDEIDLIRYVCKLFNGKVVAINDRPKEKTPVRATAHGKNKGDKTLADRLEILKRQGRPAHSEHGEKDVRVQLQYNRS